MSFFNSKPWAKIPTDLLENKAMTKAEQLIAPELRSAPVLFYLAGAMKADDDGIFDIGDGEEFAALIKVNSPATVSEVAAAMVKMRIFAHVPESSIYIFVEWEYSTRQTGKLLRDRFAIASNIWKHKREESAYFGGQSTKVDNMRQNSTTLVNECSNTILGEVNKCSNTIQGPAAPIPQNRREREDERETEQIIPDVEKSTHTRVEGAGGEEPSGASEPLSGSPAPSGEISIDAQSSIDQQDTEKLITVPDWSIVPESDASEQPEPDDIDQETEDASFVPEEIQKIRGDTFAIFQLFFKTSNAGYNMKKGGKAVEGIVTELLESLDDKAQAPEIAKKICEEFRKMNLEPGPKNKWHGIPLFPTYMQKEVVWAQLLSRVRITHPADAVEPEPEEEIDTQAVDEWLDDEYKKYGLVRGAPGAVGELLRAKQNEAVHAADSV